MGDWRHFGESIELAGAPYECSGLSGVDLVSSAPAPPAARRDPDAIRGNLGRIIESEILPRLMLTHREARLVKLPITRHPTPDEIVRLCELLLDPSVQDITSHMLDFLGDGLSLEVLLLEMLTPAARHLGKLWEEDEIDFVAVTVAIGRLQAVARELCSRLEADSRLSTSNSVLLLPCPGETHTFCLSIVGSFFREAGWDVTTAGFGPGFDLIELVRQDWFDVIGVTLACDVLLPALKSVVRELRVASCNSKVRILVGGPFFGRHPDLVPQVGADALVTNARCAPTIAESLLEKQARAC